MHKHSRWLGGLLLLSLAATLTFFRIPLASSQGLTLVSAPVTGALPVSDPGSALWLEATAIEVPLSAQNVTRPMLPATRVKAVTARSLHNDSQLAILVEWADETHDDSMIRVQDFRDAVALQFPLAAGQPFFCMGQQGGDVNIWHWKADWQADITARADMNSPYPNMHVDQYPFTIAVDPLAVAAADYVDPNYLPALASGNLFASETRASPVEDVIAGGFGSLTAQSAEGQNVQGYGAWADGAWRVIFARDLTSIEAEDVTFAAGQVYSMSFAAWDGANGERNGQKSTSQWVGLQIGAQTTGAAQPDQPQPPRSSAAAPSDPLGMLYVFGPVVLVAGLIIVLAGGALALSALLKPKDRP